MATAAPPAPVLVLHNTLGAYFVADMLAGVLLGGLFAQTWIYYNNFPHDMLPNKILVGFVFLCNLFHQILICHPLYEITISHYGDMRFLAVLPWTFIAMSFMNAFIACTIQLWYTYRIWRLSKNSILMAAPIAILAIGQFVVNTIMCGIAANLKNFTEVPKVEPYIKAFSAMGAGIDLLIALAMALLLNKSRTGFKRTDSVINKLMLYCANTGLLTGIAAILTVVLLVSFNGTSINYPPYFSLPRLYGISFVAILNARNSVTGSSRGDDVSMSMQSRGRSQFKDITQSAQPAGHGVSINISQTVMHDEALDSYGNDKRAEYP